MSKRRRAIEFLELEHRPRPRSSWTLKSSLTWYPLQRPSILTTNHSCPDCRSYRIMWQMHCWNNIITWELLLLLNESFHTENHWLTYLSMCDPFTNQSLCGLLQDVLKEATLQDASLEDDIMQPIKGRPKRSRDGATIGRTNTVTPYDWCTRHSVVVYDEMNDFFIFVSLSSFENGQRWAKRWSLGCEKFQPGLGWLLLSKTGPPFSPFVLQETDRLIVQTCIQC